MNDSRYNLSQSHLIPCFWLCIKQFHIQEFQLSPTMAAMNTSHFFWLNSAIKKQIIAVVEPATFNMNPKILPIGPLMAINECGNNSVGILFSEDLSCLKWLDQQPTQSVIYIAFGTSATFDQTQFKEFATRIELSHRPFL